MSPLSHAFTLHTPDKPPLESFRIARDWLVRIGAKNLQETPPHSLDAVFGSALTFGWKRRAKKVLHLEFQPADGGSMVSLGIKLTAAHADEAALFSARILSGWQEFANELWALYGGGASASPLPVAASTRSMTPGRRAYFLVLGIVMLAALVLILVTGVRGFVAYVLGGGLIGGGLFSLAQAFIGRETVRS